MILVVLDSNIFISGFLFNGKQRKIIEYALEGKFKICTSEKILNEILEVIKRPKFKLSNTQVRFIITEIESLCEICYPSQKIQNICRDSDDHIILECAIESKANFIITGDDDLLCLKSYMGIKIINSASFLEYIDNLAAST